MLFEKEEKSMMYAIRNICKNLDSPAIDVSDKGYMERRPENWFRYFIDVWGEASFSLSDKQINSCKKYRHLHCLVKQAVTNALLDHQNLVNVALKKLGYCVSNDTPIDKGDDNCGK